MDATAVFAGDPVPFVPGDEKPSEAITIVLRELPEPDDSVAWEQIIDFRNDADARTKFLELRNWMGDIARAKLKPLEIEQKLEYLIHQYQEHLRRHGIKTTIGVLQAIILVPFDVVNTIARALFEIKERRIDLMDKEQTAPGHEVAYIVEARRAFNKR